MILSSVKRIFQSVQEFPQDRSLDSGLGLKGWNWVFLLLLRKDRTSWRKIRLATYSDSDPLGKEYGSSASEMTGHLAELGSIFWKGNDSWEHSPLIAQSSVGLLGAPPPLPQLPLLELCTGS